MNYTINEIPDTATEANNTDYAIMWQDKTKKISISNLFKKLVKKSEVTNTISPINENPVTSKAVSSLLTISASTTTIKDAPPLQNGITLRIFFTSEITGTDNTTVLQISYNGTVYNVKVPKDGALQNYVAFEVSSGVFKYIQAYTTLELLFDGTQFVIIGNPVVLSGSNYLYYADGSHNTDVVASGNMQSVTSNGVNYFVESNFNKVNSHMTSGNNEYIEIGCTINAQNNQSFSLIEIQAGRVDGYFSSGIITIAYDGTRNFIRGIRTSVMSGVNIYAIKKDNQTYLYASLSSYSALNVKIAKNSRFNVTMKTVDNLDSNIIWNDEWLLIATN